MTRVIQPACPFKYNPHFELPKPQKDEDSIKQALYTLKTLSNPIQCYRMNDEIFVPFKRKAELESVLKSINVSILEQHVDDPLNTFSIIFKNDPKETAPIVIKKIVNEEEKKITFVPHRFEKKENHREERKVLPPKIETPKPLPPKSVAKIEENEAISVAKLEEAKAILDNFDFSPVYEGKDKQILIVNTELSKDDLSSLLSEQMDVKNLKIEPIENKSNRLKIQVNDTLKNDPKTDQDSNGAASKKADANNADKSVSLSTLEQTKAILEVYGFTPFYESDDKQILVLDTDWKENKLRALLAESISVTNLDILVEGSIYRFRNTILPFKGKPTKDPKINPHRNEDAKKEAISAKERLIKVKNILENCDFIKDEKFRIKLAKQGLFIETNCDVETLIGIIGEESKFLSFKHDAEQNAIQIKHKDIPPVSVQPEIPLNPFLSEREIQVQKLQEVFSEDDRGIDYELNEKRDCFQLFMTRREAAEGNVLEGLDLSAFKVSENEVGLTLTFINTEKNESLLSSLDTDELPVW